MEKRLYQFRGDVKGAGEKKKGRGENEQGFF